MPTRIFALRAGAPPGKRKGNIRGAVSQRWKNSIKALFGGRLEVGAVSTYTDLADSTLKDWAKQGYIVPWGTRWQLTEKGKGRAS